MPHETSAAPRPTSHTLVSQRLRLHYLAWGNEAAPPIVLVHGGRDNCHTWDWLAPHLARRWRVIAPDLRGHGDSQWTSDGSYTMHGYLYDLAQLIHQLRLAPVPIIAHSLGGMISTRYAAACPDNITRMVLIEGLGLSPRLIAATESKPPAVRLGQWVERTRALAGRVPRRYPSLTEAAARMREANKRLTEEQAHHLTLNSLLQNEDGTWTWKFDPYLHVWPPYDMPSADIAQLWKAIRCPLLCLYGGESEASDPREDGRAAHLAKAEFVTVPGAGHWVHHDRLDAVIELADRFLDV